MSYIKKTVSTAICIIFLCSNFVLAENSTIPSDTYSENGLVLPPAFMPFANAIISEIEQKNAFELSTSGISVTYNKDGTISSVSYENGTVITYSHEFNEYGKETSCSLESPDAMVVFSKEKEGEHGMLGGKKDNLIIEIYLKNKKGKSAPDNTPVGGNTPVAVYYYSEPEIDIEDIARTPIKFDFSEIKEAMMKAQEEKYDAHREYMNNTKSYYEKIYTELKTRFESFGPEIDIDEDFKNIGDENIYSEKDRELIDYIVEQIRSESELDEENDTSLIGEFLDIEEMYRIEFLEPNEETYEIKLEKAMKYINDMIDKLLKSFLTIYLNCDEEKIDVIINLPEKEEKNSFQ